MQLRELGLPSLGGQLNDIIRFGENGSSQMFLRRFPKENPQIMHSLAYEYHNMGFTQRGGRFRRRNPSEQAQFTGWCASHGLRTLPPSLTEGNHVYSRYLSDATTLDDFLPDVSEAAANETAFLLMTDMFNAHEQGVVYGDRWSKNILVEPSFGPLHIDFDLEIYGPPAKEFDLAQMAYYIICGGKEKVAPIIGQLIRTAPLPYNPSHIETFLRGHEKHFKNNQRYGGVEAEVNTVVEMMYSPMAASSAHF